MTATIRIPKQISLSVSNNVPVVLVWDTEDDLWIIRAGNESSGALDTRWVRLPTIVVDDDAVSPLAGPVYPVPTEDGVAIANTINLQYTTYNK